MQWLINLFKREPDFIIGGKDDPYLRRWWIIPRNPIFNIYLHQFLRDDEDRALHDHPWASLSIILKGGYMEKTRFGERVCVAGDFIWRWPRFAHRIVLLPYFWPAFLFSHIQDPSEMPKQPCWTLFITGPKVREWGFHCPQGFVPWQVFTEPGNSGQVGRGCN